MDNTILVVEDDPELQEVLTLNLQNAGYRVLEAEDGASGLARFRAETPDAVLLDLRMPGKDLSKLHKAALSLRGGGVGYYADSQFVHMDTGRLRNW